MSHQKETDRLVRPMGGTRSRLRGYTTGGSYAAYEAAKAAWDAANPGALYRERDAAMQRLARSMGV